MSTEFKGVAISFEPEASDSKPMAGHGGKIYPSESSLEQVGNTDW